MFDDLLIPLISVGLAEIGDKTQLALLCLAGKTNKHVSLFLGAMTAFFIVDGLAVVAGGFLAELVPQYIIKILSGTLFIGFGISFILQRLEENATCDLKQPFMSAFSMILLSEMGDKTQIASALFATNYNSYMVMAGVMLGLAIISLITIQLGYHVLKKIHANLLHKISGIIFILLGLSMLFTLFI
ncbi:MAG: TMEM165/GDT1 family protein [Fidelibacterota bacterium]